MNKQEAKLQEVGEIIENHLNDIAMLFKPGAKLTFIARTPGNPDADMLMTIDSLDEIAALVQRRKDAVEAPDTQTERVKG